MRTDGWRGRHMTKLIVSFSNTANARNNVTKAVNKCMRGDHENRAIPRTHTQGRLDRICIIAIFTAYT